MNLHPFFRLLRWPRPLLTLVAAIFAIIISLQGDIPLNKVKPVSATTSPVSQQQDRCLVTQPTTGLDLLRQGQACYQAGQFTNAEAAWAKAEQYFVTQGDTLNQAVALSNRALAYRQLGYIDDGVITADNSVALVESLGRLTTQGFRIYGQTLNTQGSLYLAQGQTKDAWQAWKRATEQYQQAGYSEGVVKSLLNEAQALRSLGFFRQSNTRISQVETLLEDQPESILKAELALNMGETQRLLGNLDESARFLNEQLGSIESLNPSDDLVARLQLSLANTQRILAKQKITSVERTGQQIDKAEEYQDVLGQYKRIPKTGSLIPYIRGQLNQLAILIEINNWTDAQPLYTSLLAEINELPLGRSLAFSRLTLAHLLLDVEEQCKGDVSCPPAGTFSDSSQQIRNLLTTVRDQTRESTLNQTPSDPIAYSYALGYLGQLDKLEGKNTEAQQVTEQALTITKQPSINYQWNWQLGQLSNNKTRKLWYYDKAFQDVKKVRDDIVYGSPDVRFDFRDRIEPLYREYISLLLLESKTPDSTNADNVAQLALAQTVIDNLRVAELQNFLACGLFHAGSTQPLASIQEIADDTSQRTAIIYPIILEDRLEVLIQLPQQSSQSKNTQKSTPRIKRYPSNLETATALEKELKDFRRELEQPYFSTERGVPKAKELYDWLIAPAEDEGWLNSIDTLVFVLDGAFRNVPMAALYDQQTEQFLVEKFAIAVTFGDLEIPQERPNKDFRILAAGLSKDPVLPPDPVNPSQEDIFGPLTYVQNEITQIPNKIDRSPTVFLDSNFRETEVKRAMRSSDYNVVHLATHGEFGFTRNETYLVAAAETQNDDNKINASKIKLDSFDTLLTTRNRTPLQLLILSACETARGDDREVLGIAGLAVQTEARTTLATLWNINDRATSNLMTDFYNELSGQGITKAKALQKSQISLLKAGYRPSVWSPYLMVGDWR